MGHLRQNAAESRGVKIYPMRQRGSQGHPCPLGKHAAQFQQHCASLHKSSCLAPGGELKRHGSMWRGTQRLFSQVLTRYSPLAFCTAGLPPFTFMMLHVLSVEISLPARHATGKRRGEAED